MTENTTASGAADWSNQQYLQQLAKHYADSPVPEIREHHRRLTEIARAIAASAPVVPTRYEVSDGTRTLQQDVLSAIADYARSKPEHDATEPESWESWFEAAFDLCTSRVRNVFIEHAQRAAEAAPVAPTQPAGEIVVTKNDAGHIVAVIRQNAEGGVLSVLAISAPIYEAAPVAPTQPASITLDFKQATELLGMYGGEPTEVTLMVGNGHSGKGVYAHWTSVPEEGAMFLGASDDEAAPVAPTQPAPFNPRTRWLTVVYRGVEAGDEAKVICEHPKVSAVSWSHALDDRDAALAAAPKAAPITDAEQAAWHAGLDEGRSQVRGAAQAAPAPVDKASKPDGTPCNVELRGLWYSAGGYFHGPTLESATMPEALLLPFLRSLLSAPPAPASGEPVAASKHSLSNDPRLCCRSHPHADQGLHCQLREVAAWLRWHAATGKTPRAESMHDHAEQVDAVALALIAPPAQEARVPLSSKECRDMLEEVDHYNFAIDLIRAVEKHHGITAAQQKEAP